MHTFAILRDKHDYFATKSLPLHDEANHIHD